MAALRCPKCGSFGPAGTAFCAFCGTPYIAGAAPPPSAAPPIPSFSTYVAGPPGRFPPFAPASSPPPTDPAREREALGYIQWVGVLLVVGGILSLGSYLFGAGTVSSSYRLSTPALLFILLGGGIELVVAGLAWLAFRKLRPVDGPRFTTPYRLTLLLAFALVALLALLDSLLSALASFVSCSGGSTNNTTLEAQCLSHGSFGALIGLTFLFGILALVGLVGLLLGLWRLGDRYRSSFFKVGAILTIFPVLNLVGGVLLYLAAKEAVGRLGGGAGWGPGGPPP